MALTLNQIRTFVRSHLDLEIDDLPDTLLDVFIREGSKRIERAEPRWPFYEFVTIYAITPNVFNIYPLTGIQANIDKLASLDFSGTSFGPLQWLGRDAFAHKQATRPSATGRPLFWTLWAENLSFFPQTDATYNVLARGYRKANDWMTGGSGAVPDMPDELHNTVATWALAKAYAQQEDPELAALYERQFSDELNEYRRRLVITPFEQPMILNGGMARHGAVLARPRWAWEND